MVSPRVLLAQRTSFSASSRAASSKASHTSSRRSRQRYREYRTRIWVMPQSMPSELTRCGRKSLSLRAMPMSSNASTPLRSA